MKYYLIYKYNCLETYVHEFNTREEASEEYSYFEHVDPDEAKIILAKGFQLNKAKRKRPFSGN